MLSFADPCQENVKQKLTKQQLIRAIRHDIVCELKAIHAYDARVLATDDAMVQRVVSNIRDDGKAHVSQLLALTRVLESEIFTSSETQVERLLSELEVSES